jgi:hypothetical protein
MGDLTLLFTKITFQAKADATSSPRSYKHFCQDVCWNAFAVRHSHDDVDTIDTPLEMCRLTFRASRVAERRSDVGWPFALRITPT